jgi:hypothetical protein
MSMKRHVAMVVAVLLAIIASRLGADQPTAQYDITTHISPGNWSLCISIVPKAPHARLGTLELCATGQPGIFFDFLGHPVTAEDVKSLVDAGRTNLELHYILNPDRLSFEDVKALRMILSDGIRSEVEIEFIPDSFENLRSAVIHDLCASSSLPWPLVPGLW